MISLKLIRLFLLHLPIWSCWKSPESQIRLDSELNQVKKSLVVKLFAYRRALTLSGRHRHLKRISTPVTHLNINTNVSSYVPCSHPVRCNNGSPLLPGFEQCLYFFTIHPTPNLFTQACLTDYSLFPSISLASRMERSWLSTASLIFANDHAFLWKIIETSRWLHHGLEFSVFLTLHLR